MQQRRARGRAGVARRRPDAADPRHLRPARGHRRGQAPGRARAARVQPAAHARPLAAPRAARRRGRDAGPGREPARDRPPPRAPADLASAPAPERARQAARNAAQGAAQRSETPTIALAGYTNVGKSTLLNALTGADASVDDRLFETLDPTTRGVRASTGAATSSPTRSGSSAGCRTSSSRASPPRSRRRWSPTSSLHVADASAPEERLDEMLARGRARARRDRRRRAAGRARPEQDRRAWTRCGAGGSRTAFPDALQVSARTGEGLDELRARVAERFAERFEAVRLLIPYEDGARARRAVRARRADRRAGRPARRRLRPRAPAARARCGASPAILVAEPRGARRVARVIELPIRATARRTRSLPERAYAGDAGLDLGRLRAARARARGSGRSSGPASRSRFPRATRASSSRARASRHGTGSRS